MTDCIVTNWCGNLNVFAVITYRLDVVIAFGKTQMILDNSERGKVYRGLHSASQLHRRQEDDCLSRKVAFLEIIHQDLNSLQFIRVTVESPPTQKMT